jgi:hypothetical protein
MEPDGGRWAPIQTGFLLFNPSLISSRYDEVVNTIKRGQFLGTGLGGWENSGIGYFYGGATTAGVLTYTLAKNWGTTNSIWDYAKFVPDDSAGLSHLLIGQADSSEFDENGILKARKGLQESLMNDNYASDGTSYDISYPKWPFKEIQWLRWDEYNVLSRQICHPKKGHLWAVSRIRSVHFTGAFETASLIKSRKFSDNGFANDWLGGEREFSAEGAKFKDCKGIFQIIAARQLALLLRAKERTGVELQFWINQAQNNVMQYEHSELSNTGKAYSV